MPKIQRHTFVKSQRAWSTPLTGLLKSPQLFAVAVWAYKNTISTWGKCFWWLFTHILYSPPDAGTAFFKVTFLPLLFLTLSKLNHVSPPTPSHPSTPHQHSQSLKWNYKKNTTHTNTLRHTHTRVQNVKTNKQLPVYISDSTLHSFNRPSWKIITLTSEHVSKYTWWSSCRTTRFLGGSRTWRGSARKHTHAPTM